MISAKTSFRRSLKLAWLMHILSRSPCVQSDPNAEPYWRDVGTLEAYWKANLDLASVTPELDMYDQNWPIRTHMESLPPAKFVQDRSGSHGMTLNSLVSGGALSPGRWWCSRCCSRACG